MISMIILTFLLAYPVFIVTAYVLAKLLFPDLKKIEEQQKLDRALLYQRAKRVKREARVAAAKVNAKPTFTFPSPSKAYTQRAVPNF